MLPDKETLSHAEPVKSTFACFISSNNFSSLSAINGNLQESSAYKIIPMLH